MKFRIIEHDNHRSVIYFIETMTQEKSWFREEKWEMIYPSGTMGYFSNVEKAEAALVEYIKLVDYPKSKIVKEIETHNVKN